MAPDGGMKVIETSESQDLEGITAKILQRISAEPADKISLCKILVFCESARSYSEIWNEAQSYPEMKASLQTPQTLLKWLVEAGGIDQVAVEGPEPKWQTTLAGRNVVQIENPANQLEQLLAKDPIYREVFLQVLQSCWVPRSRSEIESMLSSNALLESPKIYPSYFIETLEQAGGLAWDGNWRTTQAGREIVK
jgi:hypothetical protein